MKMLPGPLLKIDMKLFPRAHIYMKFIREDMSKVLKEIDKNSFSYRMPPQLSYSEFCPSQLPLFILVKCINLVDDIKMTGSKIVSLVVVGTFYSNFF